MDIKELPPAKRHHFKPGAACAHAQAAAEEGLPPVQPGPRRPRRPGLEERRAPRGKPPSAAQTLRRPREHLGDALT